MPAPRFYMDNYLSATNRIARQINRNLIFNQIRTRQPISRADLARSSGLQRSTVSLIVEELLQERWIVEGSVGQIPRGRRPTFLNLNVQRSVLAVDIHPSQTTLAVTDLGGTILAQRHIQLPANPARVVGAIVTAIRRKIAAHPDLRFEGIGINMPGRLDPQMEKFIFAPNVEWPIGHLKSRVEKATGLPVVVDNVANACALSEVWYGYSDGHHDLVVVNVSEGVGTGIYANGQLLRGAGGVAGEFGHVQMEAEGRRCGCGSHGCWETIASNRAGMRYYAEITGKTLASFDELLRLVDTGDSAATRAFQQMCQALGRGIHMIALALAPHEIVVVGDITSHWNLAGPLIEQEMISHRLVKVPLLRPAHGGSTALLGTAAALIMSGKLL